MTLKNLVENIENLKEGVSAVVLNNGYAIGLERYRKGERSIIPRGFSVENRGDDIKYHLFRNFSDNQNIPLGYNATFLSDGVGTGFSHEAYKLLEKFSQRLRSPTRDLEGKRNEIYEEMLQPLGIEPVYKRKWGYSLPIIGMTLTYPVSAPLTYLYYKKIKGIDDIDGVSISRPILTTPFQFLSAIRELISSSQKGNRITNKSILKTECDGVSPGLEFREKESPNLFGDGSGDGRPYIDLVFPDGLELCRGNTIYPKDKNHYGEARYFLPIKSNLREDLYLSVGQTENEFKKGREFRENISREDVAGLAKTINF